MDRGLQRSVFGPRPDGHALTPTEATDFRRLFQTLATVGGQGDGAQAGLEPALAFAKQILSLRALPQHIDVTLEITLDADCVLDFALVAGVVTP